MKAKVKLLRINERAQWNNHTLNKNKNCEEHRKIEKVVETSAHPGHNVRGGSSPEHTSQ